MIKLLPNENIPLVSNACGCLRNLSYGKRNDRNKLTMKQNDGVPALVKLFRSIKNSDIREQATGSYWFKKMSCLFTSEFAFYYTNQIFHYTHCVTPKRVTSLRGLSPRHCGCGQHSIFCKIAAAVARRWQHCVPFDGPEI